MIDLKVETPISLDEARQHRLLKHRNGGRGVAFSTIWSWAKRGYGGVKLETIRTGRSLATTEQALIRFFEQISQSRHPMQLQEASYRRAEQELERAGI